MVFSILELWWLDSMLVVHLPCLHSAFRNYVAMILVLFTTFAFCNYVASIPRSLFHLRYLNSAFPILELCCLDSMFLVFFFLRYVHSGIMLPRFHDHWLRIYYAVIMLPRFHRVRTRWPGNNLWTRLKCEKLEPISRIFEKVTFKMSLADLVDEAFIRELVERGFSYKSISERLRVLFPGKSYISLHYLSI